jgi:hypothetical protein
MKKFFLVTFVFFLAFVISAQENVTSVRATVGQQIVESGNYYFDSFGADYITTTEKLFLRISADSVTVDFRGAGVRQDNYLDDTMFLLVDSDVRHFRLLNVGYIGGFTAAMEMWYATDVLFQNCQLNGQNNGHEEIISVIESCSDVHFEGGSFMGWFEWYDCQNVSFDSVHFRRAYGKFDNCDDVTFFKCDISAGYRNMPIWIIGDRTVVDSCRIHGDEGDNGLRIYGNDFIIRDSIFDGIDTGLYVEGANGEIITNIFNGVQDGVASLNLQRTAFFDNVFEVEASSLVLAYMPDWSEAVEGNYGCGNIFALETKNANIDSVYDEYGNWIHQNGILNFINLCSDTSGTGCGSDTIGSSAVEDKGVAMPDEFQLHQNYPNPFNPTTTIFFEVVKVSEVKLAVYDILGREVVILVDDIYLPGEQTIIFNGADLPSGIYFARAEIDGINTELIKMVLNR